MKTEPEERALTPKQRLAAELLGMGRTQREAAAQAGVHERTVSNWMRLPEFRQACDEATGAFVQAMRPRAWDVFARHLEDDDKKIAQQAAAQVLKIAEGGQGAGSVVVAFAHMPRPGEVGDGTV
ncbi:MAG: hypothetical protein LBM74_08800 [Oscillospiraceae bacterium]|jgi:transposase-like protein|nr:hypothetical protein [Oscillospiraceae bacterium]